MTQRIAWVLQIPLVYMNASKAQTLLNFTYPNNVGDDLIGVFRISDFSCRENLESKYE
jgi:hypothetical protein